MIKIFNISKDPNQKGKQQYVLMINRTEITTFEHKYEDGLAACLRAAADAAEAAKSSTIIDLIKRMRVEGEFKETL